MADLLGGPGVTGPATSNGNGASSSRTARAPVGTTGSPSGVRTPRTIMQQRAAREARQREEREQMERVRAEEEARLLEEQQRRTVERRAAAAGAGPSGTAGVLNPADNTAPRRAVAAEQQRMTNEPGGQAAATSRIPSASQAQPSQRHARATSAAAQAAASAGPTAPTQPVTSAAPAGESANAGTRGRNSFPHAFERWETLSAHWEGLTSFWIRRLEQNAEEISRDPLSSQLSRQVTDLSSAGANLFHAVVELQRLRASSERKFQRWFFETRAELERNQEVTAMLEAALEEERRNRAEAIRDAVDQEKNSSKVQKQLAEMRKELMISKEEARRAWEELGRREQEERDRTTSLQSGLPTLVGGVQVVPMTQGVSRHGSSRQTQSYTQEEPQSQYTQPPSSQPEYTQAPAVQPVTTTAGSYTQPGQSIHHQGSYGSEGGYSEGEYTIDAQGNFVRDSRGNKIPFRAPDSPPSTASPEFTHNPRHRQQRREYNDQGSDDGAEDFETPAAQPAAYAPGTNGSHQAPTSAPDYSGQEYAAPGWETMPRHHHPTRLSDVIEEDDERSRTSASQSQVSRVSRP